jgi:hypothetical protein
MQPAASIPPYTEEGLERLKGLLCRFPVKSNPAKGWWGEITHVRFVNANSAAVWIVPNCAKAGNCRWVDLSTVTFRHTKTDPLAMAICRARDGL